jgi:hypothetical protein
MLSFKDCGATRDMDLHVLYLCAFYSHSYIVLPTLAVGLTLASKNTSPMIGSSCNILDRGYTGRTIDWACKWSQPGKRLNMINNDMLIQQTILPTWKAHHRSHYLPITLYPIFFHNQHGPWGPWNDARKEAFLTTPPDQGGIDTPMSLHCRALHDPHWPAWNSTQFLSFVILLVRNAPTPLKLTMFAMITSA